MPHLTLFSLLDANNLTYVAHSHPPLYNVGDAEKFGVCHEGANSKNLFLKDKKDNFLLVSVLDFKRVDLKSFAKLYAKGGLSFAKPEDLKSILNLLPGSVTPYGLINDIEHKVKFFLDEDFLKHDLINFHPLRNDMTVSTTPEHFLSFCTVVDHTPSIISIPVM
jgi:Ala-tRNA(Pro) deacylase